MVPVTCWERVFPINRFYYYWKDDSQRRKNLTLRVGDIDNFYDETRFWGVTNFRLCNVLSPLRLFILVYNEPRLIFSRVSNIREYRRQLYDNSYRIDVFHKPLLKYYTCVYCVYGPMKRKKTYYHQNFTPIRIDK